jgi:hypothetical protein
MAQLNFNAEDVKPQDSFEPLPAGWYTAMITQSEMKPTKNGAGEYLQLRLDVIDGEYEGRVLFDRLNLRNENQTAVEIAQRQLSAICHAVGVLTPNDSTELHDKPLKVKVAIRPAGNGYEASNEVKAYAEAGHGASSTAPQSQQGGAAEQPAKKPWQ